MKKRDFYYDLPEERIAQTPVEPRDRARLLSLNRKTGETGHYHFYDLPAFLRPEDCLILNDTRVLPARLYGVKEETGATVEFVLLRQLAQDTWEALAGPGKKARPGSRFVFGEGLLAAQVLEVAEGGNRVVRFEYDGVFYDLLDRVGQMPLPPYITEKLADKERYQTVYSRELGSAAAPTAGLHFTPQLLERIQTAGVSVGYVTLHVGLGTFRPVKEEEIENHKMHAEHYYMPAATAALINRTKAAGGRVICVGTTSCRTVESAAPVDGGPMAECSGDTNIFIYPGYQFKCMDGLVTNFHLPESTLIMLVSAFAGYEPVMAAYRLAVQEKYRFFSFGDAMLVV
ncbi:MAG: tRNA preQ1(34) S-adenosylmethionine ribosyltransferase-isomerase QueA [Clostridiales bacterium]|nr:tRNA preQ1(34) S-adenosylmethionine ribosyltransferase-isomerase QueA [Clostridiales bacterium]